MKYLEVLSINQLAGYLLLIFIAVAGCATSSIRDEQEKSSVIIAEQPVVVVPIGYRAGKFADCVQNAIHRVCPNLQFFSSENFVDLLFPWFEPNTAPKSKEDLDAMLTNSLIQSRIDNLGLRYVITVGGKTFQETFHGVLPDWIQETLLRAGGIAYIEADRKTDIYVSVIDLKEAKFPLKTESHKDKTHMYAWAFFFPLFIKPAITETPACNEIGEKIAQQISGCEPAVVKEVKYFR